MSASAHPFATVLLSHDTTADIVYVAHAVRYLCSIKSDS
jgi:hypothetical protein